MVVLDSMAGPGWSSSLIRQVRTLRAQVHHHGWGLECWIWHLSTIMRPLLFPLATLLAQSFPFWKTFLLKNGDPPAFAVKNNLAVVAREWPLSTTHVHFQPRCGVQEEKGECQNYCLNLIAVAINWRQQAALLRPGVGGTSQVAQCAALCKLNNVFLNWQIGQTPFPEFPVHPH